MELSASYRLAEDEASLLSNSAEERSNFTYTDRNISDYQLEKLQFIAYSRLHVGAVRDADCALHIYNELRTKYGNGDTAGAVLNVMLKVSGVDCRSISDSPSDIDGHSDEEFHWRKTLIQYSDKAVKKRKVEKFINYLYRAYNINTSKERYRSCDSPITLFQDMIDDEILQMNNREDIETVGKFFNFCKQHYILDRDRVHLGYFWWPWVIEVPMELIAGLY